MQIAISDKDIVEFMEIINRQVQEHPILVDKYLMGKEIEVDAVCDGEDILIPGIMEHIERAGIHSGDSISVYPAQSISQKIVDMLKALDIEPVWLVGAEFEHCDTPQSFCLFDNVEQVKEAIAADKPHGKYILVKGSNSTKLFELPELL